MGSCKRLPILFTMKTIDTLVEDIYNLFEEVTELDHQDLLKRISHRQELTIKKALRILLSQGHLKLSVQASGCLSG